MGSLPSMATCRAVCSPYWEGRLRGMWSRNRTGRPPFVSEALRAAAASGKCSRVDRPAARPLLGLHRLSPRGEGAARSSYAGWAGPRDSDGLNPSLLTRLQTKYLQLAKSFPESNCKRKEPLRLRCFRFAGLPTWKGGPDSAQPLPDTGPYREGPTRPVPCGH